MVSAEPVTPCSYGPPHSRSDYARILVDMNAMSIALGAVLIVGSIISTLPQHAKIWKSRSSVGVSFGWLFLGNINQFSGALTALVLKFPQEGACTVLGLGRCLPSLLSLIQLYALWIFTFPIYLWCLKFTDHRSTTIRERAISKYMFGSLLIILLALSAIAAALIVFTGECSHATLIYGKALGYISTTVTFAQWTPQIYATFKRKSVGNFSIAMLCIQCPGSAIIVYFLIFSSHEEFQTWLPYVSSLLQQIVLLVLLIYYHFKNKHVDDIFKARERFYFELSINDADREPLVPNPDYEANPGHMSIPSLT